MTKPFKNFLKAIGILFIIFIIVFVIIANIGRSITINLDFTESSLTMEQRIEDFEQLCDTLENGLPQLKMYDSKYEWNYESRKNTTLESIRNCTDDYEYYCIIRNFFKDIPSIHTNLAFLDSNSYLYNYFGYNTEYLLDAEINYHEAAAYWKELIKTERKKYLDCEHILFGYSDGDYYIISSDGKQYETELYIVNSINNISVNDYVINNSFAGKLFYDKENNCLFRQEFMLNTKYGEPVMVEMTDKNGKAVKKEFFYSILAENAYISGQYCKDTDSNETSDTSENTGMPESFYKYADKDTAYFNISSFRGTDGMLLKKSLAEASECKNIIIDVRGNSGGTVQYYIDYVFSELYAYNFSFEIKRYMYKNKYTDHILEFNFDSIFDIEQIDKKLYSVTEYYDAKCRSGEMQNIYILTDYTTCSAADSFAKIIQENDVGLIIGSNTGGEGATGSFYSAFLKNSGLFFTYNFSFTDESGENDNSIVGTVPNIYSAVTAENMVKASQIIENGENPYTYENRLKWDDVLIKTLELIKEKENTK